MYIERKKVLAESKAIMSNGNGIQCKFFRARNPQANTIVKWVFRTIGDILCIFKIQEVNLEDNNPSEGILASTMFSIRALVHSTK